MRGMCINFFILTFICECMSVLPFRLLAVCLFRKNFRVPVWAVAAAIIIFQAVQAAVTTVVIRSPYDVKWADYSFGFIIFLSLFLCLKAGRWQMLYHYIFILDYEITAQGIALVIDALFFRGPRQQMDALPAAIVTLIIFAAGAPFIAHFLKRSGASTSDIQAPFFWRTIWTLPAINTLIVLMNTNEITIENLIKPQYLLSRLLLFLSMFIVYVILMRIFDIIRRELTLKERAAKQEEIMATERTRQGQLERYVLEMRRIRHDNIQHMRVMESFIEGADYDALKDYMKQYEASIPTGSPKIWCDNRIANILLDYYAGECQSHGIVFEAEAHIPEKIAVSEPDLCSVLGNLLENALAACMEASVERPAMRLKAEADMKELVLTVDNTCTNSPQTDGEAFLSTKHAGTGIGTASVRSVVEKYHGRADFRYEAHMFYASVLLFTPEAGPVM